MKDKLYTAILILFLAGVVWELTPLKGWLSPTPTITATTTTTTTTTPIATIPIPAKTDTAKATAPATNPLPSKKERKYIARIESLFNRIAQDSGAHHKEIDSLRHEFTRLTQSRSTTFRDLVTVKDTNGTIISQVQEAHYVTYNPVDSLFTKHTTYDTLVAYRVEVKEATTLKVEVSWWEKLEYRTEGFVAGAVVAVLAIEAIRATR